MYFNLTHSGLALRHWGKDIENFGRKRLKNYFFIYFLFFYFLGPHPQPMEVPRLGVQSELLAFTAATATSNLDPSCVCDLHHSSRQCRILNPLSEARDWTLNITVPSQICFRCPTMGTPRLKHYFKGQSIQQFLLSS